MFKATKNKRILLTRKKIPIYPFLNTDMNEKLILHNKLLKLMKSKLPLRMGINKLKICVERKYIKVLLQFHRKLKKRKKVKHKYKLLWRTEKLINYLFETKQFVLKKGKSIYKKLDCIIWISKKSCCRIFQELIIANKVQFKVSTIEPVIYKARRK